MIINHIQYSPEFEKHLIILYNRVAIIMGGGGGGATVFVVLTLDIFVIIMQNVIPIRFKVFESIEVQDTDNSGGCIPDLIHSESLVYMVYYQLE